MTDHEPTRNVLIKQVFGLLKDKFFIGGSVVIALVFWAGWGSGDITAALSEIAEALRALHE